MSEYPHVPAAFINAIAEEGTKDEAVAFLQKQWNENCALREDLKSCQESWQRVMNAKLEADKKLAKYEADEGDEGICNGCGQPIWSDLP